MLWRRGTGNEKSSTENQNRWWRRASDCWVENLQSADVNAARLSGRTSTVWRKSLHPGRGEELFSVFPTSTVHFFMLTSHSFLSFFKIEQEKLRRDDQEFQLESRPNCDVVHISRRWHTAHHYGCKRSSDRCDECECGKDDVRNVT